MRSGSVTDELTVLSYGGGQDSWTILVLLARDEDFRSRYAPGDLWVAMSDTGDEHDQTYEHIRYTRNFCEKHGISFTHITRDLGFHVPSWPSLIEHYQAYNTIGSASFNKTCTDQLKIRVFYKWLSTKLVADYGMPASGKHGPKQPIVEFCDRNKTKIKVLLGIAGDEQKRVAKANEFEFKCGKWMQNRIERVYPLIDLDWGREDCQGYLKSVGEPIPMPSNCMRCYFMSPIELLWLFRNHPDKFAEWVVLEKAKLRANTHMGDKNYGVYGKRTLSEKLDKAIEEFGHMSDDELTEYKMSHGHCVGSRY